MERVITYDTLPLFCYANDRRITGRIRGVVLDFYGLGGMDMHDENPVGDRFAARGILFVQPYNNPWAWMNRQAAAYTDEVLDVLFARYGLPEDTPIVSSGGSMGGLSAIVYCRYAERTPAACVANCPVCDLPYHYTERPDLPRTLYSAFGNCEGTLGDAMKTASPLHLAPELPRIPYHVYHCDEDRAVNMEMHSLRFLDAMRAAGHEVFFTVCHGRGHCDLTPELWEAYYADCENAVFTP